MLVIKIKLDGVITSCDSLDIPVDVLGLLNTLNVVKIDDSEEINQNSDTSNEKTKDLSDGSVRCWNGAWDLSVEICLVTTVSTFTEKSRNR